MDKIQRLPDGGWDRRIQVVACDDLVQTFLVVTRRYLVVVDTMIHPASGRALLLMAREHLKGGRKLLVVNTHADWDHYWGNQVFEAPIVGSAACAERVRTDGRRELAEHQAAEPKRFGEVVLTAPNLTFSERLTIHGGDLTLELLPTPGHQPDHVAVWIPEIATLLAGDAAEDPFPLVEGAGNLATMRRSLAQMRALEPAWTLACHAPPQPGDTLLRANLEHFDRLERLCRNARGPRPTGDLELAEWVGWPCPPEWSSLYTKGHADAIRALC